MPRIRPGRRHPIMKYPIAIGMSRLSLRSIIGVFLIASLASSAAIAALLAVTSSPRMPYATALRFAVANAWNPGDLLERPDQSIWFYGTAVIDALLGVLLPTFLLGAFVFKLLQHDPLEWRSTVAVERAADGSPVLRFRFYNATRSQLVRTRIEVYARVWVTRNPGTMRNYALPVVLRSGKVADGEFWAEGAGGMPYLVSVPLDDRMSMDELAGSDMIYIPSVRPPLRRDLVTFIVMVDGTILDTGHPFISTRAYSAARDLTFGHYQEIGADYTKPARRWSGWKNFDGSSDLYVFGYGSLASRTSLSATLERDVRPADMMVAHLSGWRREWNVALDDPGEAVTPVFDVDGSRYDGVVAVLGIVADSARRCNGVIFPVSTEDLGRLDVRERNYDRVDVTTSVSFAGMPAGCVVFTYVPRASSVQALARAVADGRPVAIRSTYLETVRSGFETLGQLDEYEATTHMPGFELRDLRFTRQSAVPPVPA